MARISHETNEDHARNPKPGDLWQEMLTAILVVLEVTPDTVVFCRQKESAGSQHWRWNSTLTERLPRSEFYNFLHYDTMPKCWCDVVPGGHMPDAVAYAAAQRS